jgi:hypothetical protein
VEQKGYEVITKDKEDVFMNRDEKHVLEHLKYRGYKCIKYEPDGNIPPDFLVDKNIAIEVRRLNENIFGKTKVIGLENTAIPLGMQMETLIKNYGPPTAGKSWLVFYRFERPIKDWNKLEPIIRQGIKLFLSSKMEKGGPIVKKNGFNLSVIKAASPRKSMFVVGGSSDQDSGGMLIPLMEENINFCISEKSRKIEKFRFKYGQWWLALVDYIGYALDDFDREQFRNQVKIEHGWDKIIIIDPRNHERWFEI